MSGHSDFCAIRKNHFRIRGEFLNEAKDVVPTSAIQSRRVLAQFVKNFVEFEGSQNGFNQYRGAYRAMRYAQGILRVDENIVPETRFQMTFDLWQIKIRTAAGRKKLLGIVKKIECEVEERA